MYSVLAHTICALFSGQSDRLYVYLLFERQLLHVLYVYP